MEDTVTCSSCKKSSADGEYSVCETCSGRFYVECVGEQQNKDGATECYCSVECGSDATS